MSNKFNFYERVKIITQESSYKQIANKYGVIVGMSCGEGETFDYGVLMEESGICWSVPEDCIQSTGEIVPKEEIY